MSLLPAEVSRSSDARVTPQRISLEIGLPVLLASGAHYATLAVRTIAEVGSRGGAMSAEDDPRWCDVTLPIELPSGEHLTLSTSLPLALFGRVPGARKRSQSSFPRSARSTPSL